MAGVERKRAHMPKVDVGSEAEPLLAHDDDLSNYAADARQEQTESELKALVKSSPRITNGNAQPDAVRWITCHATHLGFP